MIGAGNLQVTRGSGTVYNRAAECICNTPPLPKGTRGPEDQQKYECSSSELIELRSSIRQRANSRCDMKRTIVQSASNKGLAAGIPGPAGTAY